jgi:hypothetical protein
MTRVVSILAVVLLCASARPMEAQLRPAPPTEERPPPARLEIGVRAGLDYQNDSPSLGGHARVSVDPWRRLDLLPSVEFTFQDRLTEKQFNLDGALYLDGSRTLYVGSGAAFRDTFYLDDEGDPLAERETRTGFNLFAGLHLVSPSDLPVALQLEARWTFVGDFRPRTLVVGVNYPIPLGF